jgi:hypothetical protein
MILKSRKPKPGPPDLFVVPSVLSIVMEMEMCEDMELQITTIEPLPAIVERDWKTGASMIRGEPYWLKKGYPKWLEECGRTEQVRKSWSEEQEGEECQRFWNQLNQLRIQTEQQWIAKELPTVEPDEDDVEETNERANQYGRQEIEMSAKE